ncbi:heparan-alpha-glucosaminide N-acetyltransferase domain-containing protein [Aquimarina agarilytica]|uniref:heparan-alpha-glucosaminide N-acetyltransferase domain-containing protein n=1 Tax=Aquimarina agarilytica TaxID=1087449 RepID=UPI00028A1544|nr:heparan-alpha-glucosaminide N-acetyltransferase domain-containing protein [Aquimarina agarilytica]
MENKQNRILAIDLARGISVLMVIIVHTLWMYANVPTQSNTWLGEVIHFIGKGTPMFLIAMGVSFTLSRNQSIILSIKRAGYILAMGYFMNFLKFVIPTAIGMVPDNFIEAYGWKAPATFSNMMYMLRTGDILQLAGVSLLFMGVINRFSKNKYVPLAIALVIVLTTKIVHGYRPGITGIDYIFDLLWGAEWTVYFAVFPWFSFILIGMFFGLWYKEKNTSIKYMFKRMGITGVLLMIVGGSLCVYNFEYHFGDYFHLGPGGTIYLAGFNLVLLWIANIVVTKISYNKVFEFFFYCSKRVTTIYIIQWTFICWGMSIFGYQQYGVMGILALLPLTIGVTLLVQKFILDKLFFPKKKVLSEGEKEELVLKTLRG